MNFQQLRSIREAARRGSNLTEVAHALFTSQPGVSRQIRELEDELAVVIFARNGKRLTGLTEPGKGILKIIERLLIEAENLQQASLEYSGQQSGTLSVAATHTQARYALPKVVMGFRSAFPEVRIALQQSAPEHIADWVLSGKTDIGIATVDRVRRRRSRCRRPSWRSKPTFKGQARVNGIRLISGSSRPLPRRKFICARNARYRRT